MARWARSSVPQSLPSATFICMAAAMKISTVAATMLALAAMPADAQMQGKRHTGDEKKAAQPEVKIDEKAYKAALERIPDPKQKYDPWGVARPAEPTKKSK